MLRGYRGIVAALVGWLILSGSQHPQPKTKHEQASTQQSIADSLSNIAFTYNEQAERSKGSKETEPCKAGDDRRYSDLCAQWKAADAAANAAWWARVSGVLSVAGLFGVAGALLLTIKSNDIARDSAKRQLMAYVYMGDPEFIGPFPSKWPGSSDLGVKFKITNFGQTPAINVSINAGCKIETPEGWYEAFDGQLDAKNHIAPNDFMMINFTSVVMNFARIELFERWAAFEATLKLTYETTFGDRVERTLILGGDVVAGLSVKSETSKTSNAD